MLNEGERIRYLNNDAVVLVCSDDEVLLLIDRGYVKWVEKSMLETVG